MPNLFSELEMNKGYFFESDKGIIYENFSDPAIIESPDKTTTLIGYTPDKSFIYFKLISENQEILSLLRVKKIVFCGIDYYQINKISSTKKKNAYATYLYKLALNITSNVNAEILQVANAFSRCAPRNILCICD